MRVLSIISSVLICFVLRAQQFERAAGLFQKGDLATAEQVLRAALREQPGDARIPMLLGVILDQQKRFQEAEGFYRNALRLEPRSAVVLNNFGNHYLAAEQPEQARTVFLKLIAIDPQHLNGNLQLAQLAASRRNGVEVFGYLNHLPPSSREDLSVLLLQARALYWTGQPAAADRLLEKIEQQPSTDTRVNFSLGMAYAEGKRYQRAEDAFSRALESAGPNFAILYNLGLAAANAGHLDRARTVLEIALKDRPDDVDALYALARAYSNGGRREMALRLLVRARKIAPDRADVLEFLARDSDALGFYTDAAQVYAEYLKLRPNDDLTRRDRALALARANRFSEAIEELEAQVAKHPRDHLVFLYLAAAEMARNPDRALEHVNRSLAIRAGHLDSLYIRGTLLYQQSKFAEAKLDFQSILKQQSGNVRALDRLAQCYLQLNDPRVAVDVLKRASDLAPTDSKVLIHYSQALRSVGRFEEARQVLASFRAADAVEKQVPFAGSLDFLNAPPEQQRARYLANLKQMVESAPGDAALKARWGRELLAEGRSDAGVSVLRDVLALGPDLHTLVDSGKVLLDHEQYALAKDFLEAAAQHGNPSPDVRLDLAIAIFHAVSPRAGLAELDRIPAAQHNGNYFLVRAQILDALGEFRDAVEALNRGFRTEPTRADLYLAASLFLSKNKRYQEALELLEQAGRVVPGDPQLLLAQAITFEMLSRTEESLALLDRLRLRWPEWDRPYLIQGMLLQTHGDSSAAKQAIETAISLGNRSAEAYYYLALTTSVASPDDRRGAQLAIAQAMQFDPGNPYVRALAGKIAYSAGDLPAAVEHLTAALRAFPNMLEAHYRLANSYQRMGKEEQARAEFAEVRRIQETAAADKEIPSIADTLFTVRRLQ